MNDAVLPQDIADLLVSPNAYAEQTRLYAGLRWLRANNPLGRAEIEDFDPFWIVTSMPTFLKSAARTRSSTTETAPRPWSRGVRTKRFEA